MLLNVLIVILFIEVIVCLMLSKGDIISPSFLFSFVFFIAAINLKANEEYWQVNIIRTTVVIVCGGVACFTLGCMITNIFFHGKRYENNIVQETEKGRLININNILIDMIYIYYIIVAILMVMAVRNISLANGGSGSIFNLIGYYNKLSKDQGYSLPLILNQFVAVCVYMGYVWAYILVNNYLCNKKINFRIVGLFILTCICSMITGSRGDLVALSFSVLIMYVVMVKNKNRNKIIKIPIKAIIFGLVIVALFVLFFQRLGIFLGRDAYLYKSNEYLSIYIGGPLLNLNNCITRGLKEATVWGQETFIYFNHILGSVFNIESLQYRSNRVYYWANYHNTGNVCTTFYDYYFDFGIAGCMIIPFLTGIFIQKLYLIAKYKVFKTSGIGVSLIIYSYLLFMTVRSFFANSLIPFLCSPQIFKILIVCMLAELMLERIKIKI